MNTLLLGNTDLEIWDGQVGDTHSIAATWYRKNKKAQCGFQLFASWDGTVTLMILENGNWTTPIHKSKHVQLVRRHMMEYMSKHIAKINQLNDLSAETQSSFSQAQLALNDWLKEQSKVIQWVQHFR